MLDSEILAGLPECATLRDVAGVVKGNGVPVGRATMAAVAGRCRMVDAGTIRSNLGVGKREG